MRKIVFSLMVLLVVGLGASAATAQWREIGTKEVDYTADHDTLDVTAMRGDFRRIRIGVSRAPVRFSRVVLTYGNGNKQEIPIRALIKAGGQTRVIDLQGNERVIRKVDFWYESASLRKQKALVTLYGRD